MPAAGPGLQLKVEGALSPPLPPAHGITRAELARALRRVAPVPRALFARGAPSGFMKLPGRARVLQAVQKEAAHWRARGVSDVLHIGIGGSSLGAEVLQRALLHPQHNLLPRAKRAGPRVHFANNADPQTLGALLQWLSPAKTMLHVVSKSGGTVETAVNFAIARAWFEARRTDWRKRTLFTTGEIGALQKLAREQGVRRLPFPADVGGRYSVFCGSGLLTPAVAGAPVARVVAGAKRFAARARKLPPAQNPALTAAAAAWLLDTKRGKSIQAFMPYADALEALARWYVQLCGESLGKRRGRGHAGPTPLAALGATDQHSQVQLFMEGPPNKLVIFVAAGGTHALQIPRAAAALPAGLAGAQLGALLRAELAGTEAALAQAGRPSLRWEMPDAGPEALGELLLALQLFTAAQATLYGVNAYDQPGVEAGKRAALQQLAAP